MATMTFDEYFKSINDKGVDFDGNYGVQCFDEGGITNGNKRH